MLVGWVVLRLTTTRGAAHASMYVSRGRKDASRTSNEVNVFTHRKSDLKSKIKERASPRALSRSDRGYYFNKKNRY